MKDVISSPKHTCTYFKNFYAFSLGLFFDYFLIIFVWRERGWGKVYLTLRSGYEDVEWVGPKFFVCFRGLRKIVAVKAEEVKSDIELRA